MANRVSSPNLFNGLAPSWSLASLDQNSGFYQTAFNDSSLGWGNGIPIDTGSANNYTIALPFGTASAYQDGMNVEWIPANTNTGASTLTVTPLGSVSILTPAGNALQGGELAQNRPVRTTYKSAAPTGMRIIGVCPLSIVSSGLSGSLIIECAGYTSVVAFLSWSSGTGATVTLSHLAQGVPVSITFLNSVGSNQTFFLIPSSPAGTTFTVSNAYLSGQVNGGGVTNMIASGLVINNGSAATFTGGAVGPLTAVFSR